MRTREAAAELVTRWYEAWAGFSLKPTPRELRQASELVLAYTYETLADALPLVVETLRAEWPECMRFGGSDLYWTRAVKEIEARRRDDEERRGRLEKQQQRQQEAEANRAECPPGHFAQMTAAAMGMPEGCQS